MATFITNEDGTVSVRHSPEDIAEAARQNAGTAHARAEQIEADRKAAQQLTDARLAAVTPSAQDTVSGADPANDAAS